MKIVVRDIDEADGFPVGECELTEMEPIVNFMKDQDYYFGGNTFGFHSTQILPDIETLEIIIVKQG